MSEWREVERKHALKVLSLGEYVALMVRVDGKPAAVSLLHHGEVQALVNDLIAARDYSKTRIEAA